MLKTRYLFLIFSLIIISVQAHSDSLFVRKDSIPEKDIKDVLRQVFKRHSIDSIKIKKKKKFEFSMLPAAGYTLQTGFAALITANVGFYESDDKLQKMSSISANFTYSEYNQTIIPFLINYWNKGNKINFISDNRFLEYPSNIYGLGGKRISINANSNTAYTIDFEAIKLHQSVMFDIGRNWFLGGGYFYDQFWNIKALNEDKRNVIRLLSRDLGTKEIGSGSVIRILYDSRTNQINSNNGFFLNVQYRNSFKDLGSNLNWSTLLVDARKYISFPKNSNNVLAFWSYTWFTTSKNKPSYLMLPSTGWDDQYNTGRGYIQGRFRGKNMFYYENEYRFGVTRNGLLGGVVFGNAEWFSADLSNEFKKINIGYGLGIRVKFNKHSNTNLCLDYGFGSNGSKGLSVNLGEVF